MPKKENSLKSRSPLRAGKKRVSAQKALEIQLDNMCSLIVRNRKQCEKCGKQATYGKNGNVNNLYWAHIIGRGKKQIRWDLRNAMCLCFYCHNFWWHGNETDPREIVAFVESKWPGRWEELDRLIAQRPVKWTLEQLQEARDKMCRHLERA